MPISIESERAGASRRQGTAVPFADVVSRYQRPDRRRAIWQIINSFVPYFAIWYLMWRSLALPWWITAALGLLNAGFMIRIFIIQHDCGHGSFFKTPRANAWLGALCAPLTFTPYQQWRHEHAVHHATSGDLDRRGVGDVRTLTVREYQALSRFEQLKYRVYRHPLLMFGMGPLLLFLVVHRFVNPRLRVTPLERRGVYLTNLSLIVNALAMGSLMGFKTYFLLHFTIFYPATILGVWLFYVQHQYEDAYWERHAQWNYGAATLQGSSYLKLPKLFQFFTGNIGLHHIHHLNPRVANYHLQACQDDPGMASARPKVLTLRTSLSSLTLALWDEDAKKMVGFGKLARAA